MLGVRLKGLNSQRGINVKTSSELFSFARYPTRNGVNIGSCVLPGSSEVMRALISPFDIP